MRAGFVLCLLVSAVAAAPAEKSIDRRTARHLAELGRRALKEGQEATARRIFERSLELDPDQPVARAALGYRRSGAGWAAPESPPPGADADPAAAARFLREMRAEEERRADAYVAGGLSDHYAVLLERLPRHAGLHRALGHERVGSRYVRPELLEAAKRFDAQRARWRELAAPVEVERAQQPTSVPGFGPRATYPVLGRQVTGTLRDDEIRKVASTVPAVHAFLRELFEAEIPAWDPPRVVFVPRADYPKCVVALFPPGEQREHFLRWGLARTDDTAVFSSNNATAAKDDYAHAVGIYSAGRWSIPRRGEGWDNDAYAWFREGVGYFAAMALFETGITSFVGQESSPKIPPTVPPPHTGARADLLSWLREQILDGTTEPLRSICGRRLNSLDLLMSLEAWSFVEFLAAYDPAGLRALPPALREEEEGPYAERTERALRKCLGKDLVELEPLWRAFVLEIM